MGSGVYLRRGYVLDYKKIGKIASLVSVLFGLLAGIVKGNSKS
jgi:hypothetical protein